MNVIRSRSTILAFGIVCGGVIIAILLGDWIPKIGQKIYIPLFGIERGLSRLGEIEGAVLMSRRHLLEENRRLRLQVAELELELMRLRSVERENARLRALVEWQRSSPWKLKLARVVSRDPVTWWRMIQIDLGSRDGVQKDLPVLTPEGLVGKVGEVDAFYSRVYLVGDPACRVSATIENGPMGIIRGEEGVGLGIVDLVFIPRSVDVRPGQRVFTSGLGGVFPKGIPVGVVIDVQEAELGLYKRARVKLAADPACLDYVWVLIK